MTESKLSALLRQASVEPIAPEYDPVWDKASELLKDNAIEPEEDSEAIARTVRAVKFDAHTRQFRHWVPFICMVLASAVAFFALAEAIMPQAFHSSASQTRSAPLGTYADKPDVRR